MPPLALRSPLAGVPSRGRGCAAARGSSSGTPAISWGGARSSLIPGWLSRERSSLLAPQKPCHRVRWHGFCFVGRVGNGTIFMVAFCHRHFGKEADACPNGPKIGLRSFLIRQQAPRRLAWGACCLPFEVPEDLGPSDRQSWGILGGSRYLKLASQSRKSGALIGLFG